MGVMRKDGNGLFWEYERGGCSYPSALPQNLGWGDFIISAFWEHRSQMTFSNAHNDDKIINIENE